MKKLVMALAAIVIVATANATSVKWGLSSGTLDATKVDAGTMYLCYSSTGTVDWSKLSGMTSFSVASLTTLGLGDYYDSFSYSSSAINQTVSVVPTTTGTAGTAIGGGNKKFYIVCIDSDGKNMAYTGSALTVNVQNSAMASTATRGESAFTYAATSPEPTPEPTSGLLLLIGMAGLALRRRRA